MIQDNKPSLHQINIIPRWIPTAHKGDNLRRMPSFQFSIMAACKHDKTILPKESRAICRRFPMPSFLPPARTRSLIYSQKSGKFGKFPSRGFSSFPRRSAYYLYRMRQVSTQVTFCRKLCFVIKNICFTYTFIM